MVDVVPREVTGPRSASSASTLPEPPTPGWLTYEQTLRRVVVILLAASVAAAAGGLLGVRTVTATATADRFMVRVDHPGTARPGLAAPFTVTVTAAEGDLPASLRIAVTGDYLDMFDENGLDPQPASEYADGPLVMWEYEVPHDVTEFVVSFDARIEPGVRWRRAGTVRVDVGAVTLPTLRLTSWVMP